MDTNDQILTLIKVSEAHAQQRHSEMREDLRTLKSAFEEHVKKDDLIHDKVIQHQAWLSGLKYAAGVIAALVSMAFTALVAFAKYLFGGQ